MTKKPLIRATSAVLAVTLAAVIAGCGGGAGSGGTDADKRITLGVVAGWTTDAGLCNVYKAVLEENGYAVDIEEFSDIATVYIGAARGDLDAFSSAPEKLHKAYWDEYKNDLEVLGAYFPETALFLAVPDYVTDIRSIEDLPSRAEEVGGTIVGIESGAGLTRITQDNVIPDYNLEGDFHLQVSSTAAMLADLKKKTEAREPIVVTMWTPFWANSAFELRALGDPKGSYGEPEPTDTIARKGFADDHPEVANMMAAFHITNEQFGELDDMISNEFPAGHELDAAKAWLERNPDVAATLQNNLKKYRRHRCRATTLRRTESEAASALVKGAGRFLLAR